MLDELFPPSVVGCQLSITAVPHEGVKMRFIFRMEGLPWDAHDARNYEFLTLEEALDVIAIELQERAWLI